MIKILKTYISDFLNLFFPVVCQSCGSPLVKQENFICTECLYLLPKTNFHLIDNNPVSQVFWGRVNIEYASSCYFFNKGGLLQKLIHKLKYKGMKEIGYELGKQFGTELSNVEWAKNIDIVIPVPIHPKRKKQRGYNQSDWIAKGIVEILPAHVDYHNLYRAVETQTQTKKTRFERWENVENIFKIKSPQLFEGKHILIVDDILTTGATLEACANELLKLKNIKVSIATLGFTA
ncbi:MAG: ComF family protein [Chlorobi bacterium]|nr:ComF family protein [Chlorobiota bacterium]